MISDRSGFGSTADMETCPGLRAESQRAGEKRGASHPASSDNSLKPGSGWSPLVHLAITTPLTRGGFYPLLKASPYPKHSSIPVMANCATFLANLNLFGCSGMKVSSLPYYTDDLLGFRTPCCLLWSSSVTSFLTYPSLDSVPVTGHSKMNESQNWPSQSYGLT